MSFSRNRRRPVIQPIQTGNAYLSDRSRKLSIQRLSPLSGVMSAQMDSLDSVVSGYGSTKGEIRSSERQALRKLRIPETTSNVARLTSPEMLQFVARLNNPDFDPPSYNCVRRGIAVTSPSPAGQTMFGERSAISVPSSPDALLMSLSVTLSASYKPSSSPLSAIYTPSPSPHEASIRYMQLAEIQQSRLGLWEQGPRRFGRLEDADVFVRPLPLGRCRREIRSWSEDLVTPSSASPSSALPSSRRLSVRAIIHSKAHVPIGLKREFDLDALRATIPDPLPSPQSPSVNREALLSSLWPSNGEQPAPCPAESSDNEEDNEDGEYNGSDGHAKKAAEAITSLPPVKRQRLSTQSIAVPISEHPLFPVTFVRNER